MDRRLLILWITIFVDLLGFTLFIPVVPYFAAEVGVSETLVMVSIAVFSLMVFLCSPVWGSMSDRVGRRPVIMWSIVISAVSYVIFAHASGLILLFVSRILTGIGSGNIAAAQAYVSDITPPQERAKRMGLIVGASFGLAFAFGPALGGFIYSHYGLMAVGYFAAGLCVVNFLGVVFVLPESLKVKDPSRPINFKPIASTFASLKDPRFRDIFLIGFVYITAFSMMNVSMAFLWEQKYGLDVDQVGLMFSLVGVCSAIAQGGLVGVFQRWLGERRMMIWGCVLVGFGLAAIPLVPHDGFVWFSLIPIILLSVGNACLNPSLVSILSRKSDPHELGEVMGQNQGFSSLARIMGPLMAGPLYAAGMELPFWVGGAIMLGTLTLVFDYLRNGYTPPPVAAGRDRS
ncbi:MAG: MFS transporter [Flavobacteriales bacterium]|nr:MFS transporter [Flavobacteriales bacterium]